jgi:hypothetical protein
VTHTLALFEIGAAKRIVVRAAAREEEADAALDRLSVGAWCRHRSPILRPRSIEVWAHGASIDAVANVDRVSTSTITSTAAPVPTPPTGPDTAPGPDYIIDQRGCWIWQRTVNEAGYALERRGLRRAAARVYFEREHGPLPPTVCLEHCRYSRRCVNPDCQTPRQRSEFSRRQAARWLHPALVTELRERHADGASTAHLAADLGLNYWTVADAVVGRTWPD